MIARMRHASNRQLVALVLFTDLLIVIAAGPLEAASWRSAFDPESSALQILALLAANLMLLGIVAFAFAASSLVLYRAARRVARK